jgi:hypothetical protein
LFSLHFTYFHLSVLFDCTTDWLFGPWILLSDFQFQKFQINYFLILQWKNFLENEKRWEEWTLVACEVWTISSTIQFQSLVILVRNCTFQSLSSLHFQITILCCTFHRIAFTFQASHLYVYHFFQHFVQKILRMEQMRSKQDQFVSKDFVIFICAEFRVKYKSSHFFLTAFIKSPDSRPNSLI